MTNLSADRSGAAGAPLLGPVLTFAFAGAVAMWSVGYALRLPGDLVPAPAIALVLLAIHAGACVLAGRARGVRAGALTGFALASINLLVLGSLAEDFFRGDRPPAARIALFVGGWLAFGGVAGAILGGIGARLGACARGMSARAWACRLAVVTGVGAFLLLVKGGLVTSAEEGLAVPDWPNTFGSNMFLYPLSRMTGGVYLEHAHRLFGALIGLTTIALTGYTLATERRAWVKGFVVVIFLWVVLQGVLGGVRVTETSSALGMIHGVTGQMFVAMLFALAGVLSARWSEGAGPDAKPDNLLRALAPLATAALLVQIAFGAAVRHFDLQLHALISHIAWSLAATGLIIAAGFRASAMHGECAALRITGRANIHAVGLQMALGLVALLVVMQDGGAGGPSVWNLVFTTAHQAVGAMLLVVSALLALWSRRLAPAGAYPRA